MINYLEKTGKTDDEAIAAALEEIGLDRDDVSVEIIERAKPGFLGIGSVPARVRVSWESEDKEPEAAAPAAAAPEKAAEVPAAQTETAAPAKQSEPVQAPAAPADEPEDYQRVRSFLTGLLEHMGLEAEISITEREGGGLLVDLPPDQLRCQPWQREASSHQRGRRELSGQTRGIAEQAGREDGREGHQV